MPKHIIILGGGPAATNAVETFRQYDRDSQLTLVCDEPPHSRMALPYWISGQIVEPQTYTSDQATLKSLGVEAIIGQRATGLDVTGQKLTLDNGQQLAFDHLLLATGSRPLSLPVPGADLPGVFNLWTLAQTQAVLDAASPLIARQQTPRVVMIGAGFIGLIVLNAMYKRKWELTVVEREPSVLPRMLNRDAATIAINWMQDRGVSVRCGVEVQQIESGVEAACDVRLSDGSRLAADIVIVATGVKPNTELAVAAGLEVEHGILVNDQLQTSAPAIFAAGDVAQGPVLHQPTREVHAIQPTAVDHGRVVGAIMAGQPVRYPGSLSMNVLDVCGLQLASFGQWHDSPDTTTISHPEGSIYRQYVWSEDRLTGAIFAGRANDMGMLTDVGMAKGFIQTGIGLGEWKAYLQDNPFDIRRPFVAKQVAQQLAQMTLLGRPSSGRRFRHATEPSSNTPGAAHAQFVAGRE